MSYLKNRARAFGFALAGLRAAFSEAHLRIHLAALMLVAAAALYFRITAAECCVLILCSALVICLELANSAIERFCDAVVPERREEIRFVKDVMAGAVLVAALAAVAVGIAVFVPYLRACF